MLVRRTVRNFEMLLDTNDDGMSTNLLKSGSWEGRAPDIVEKLVQPQWTVIEMGACIGFYALVEAQRGASVYVIEPVPHNVEIIKKNIEVNKFYNARVFELAISGENGSARFKLSPGRSDRGRLVNDGEDTIEVETITLDTFVERHGIERVDFLRFDIEGAEIGLISGGQETLNRMPSGSWIFSDIHPTKTDTEDLKAALENLLGHGFVQKDVLAPAKYRNLPSKQFVNEISQFQGFPKVFWQKEV